MDYEKKYKEALNLARSYYDENANQFLDTLFPELAESEDERTRKEIMNFILHKAGALIDEDTEHRYIAYLEKQKERDLDIVPELRPTAWGEGYQHGCKDTEEKYSGMVVVSQEEWDTAIADAFKHGMDEGERQKECVADSSKTSANDAKKIRKELIEFIQWSEDTGLTRHDFHQAKRPSEWIAWLKHQNYLYERVYEETKDRFYREGMEEGIAYEKHKEQKDLFKDGVGHYFYDGDKAHFCSAPAMEVRELDDSNEPVEHWQYVGKVDLKEEKEQKPNIELIQKSWYMEGYHDCEFGYEPKWIIKTGEGGPKYEENPKYGQHIKEKSVEWEPQPESLEALMYAIEGKWEMIKPTSYLSRRLEDLYGGLVNAYNVDESYLTKLHETALTGNVDELRELKNKIDASIDSTAQKKQDYSGLNDFEGAIHRGFLCAGVEDVPVNIIKETAQDCLAHLSVGWSEEDENIMNDLISLLWILQGSTNLIQGTASKYTNWLRSLRPSWKPSEEQLVTLLRAEGIVRVHDTKELAAAIAQLYGQLKELK